MARVLVLEDNPAITMVIQMALNDVGHEVITAANGAEGMAIMENGPVPDIVLTDLIMEGMDGRSVINYMRSKNELKNLPVIIMTGCIPEADVLPEKGTYQGLLVKPFDLVDVVNMVERLTAVQADPEKERS